MMSDTAVRAAGTVRFTPQQRLAIETVGRDVLVSAAAGSGKTAVLAERCVHLVCDARPHCEIDELLVVTFTNAAAIEMRSRIARALRDRGAHDDSARISRQMAMIDRAQIGTIHSFCSSILKQNFQLLGLDPAFTTLDEAEQRLLRSEVARDVFDERYENDSGAFARFVDDYGNGSDDGLIQRVLSTHDLLSSIVEPDQWIDAAGKRLREAVQDFENSQIGRELKTLIERELQAAQGLADQTLAACRACSEATKYAAFVEEFVVFIAAWQKGLAAGGFDGFRDATPEAFPRKPSVRQTSAKIEQLSEALNRLLKLIKEGDLAVLALFSRADWLEGIRAIVQPTDVLLDLVQEFERRYAQAKGEIRSLDFSDLERLTLEVLRDPDSPVIAPGEVAKSYRQRFAHVLVDEYQDVNEVQEAILQLVSRETVPGDPTQNANLFCVGDVKQSIYRFRQAGPERFVHRYELFKSGARDGLVIDLQENFRSRQQILHALNGVFQLLMTRQAAEVQYTEAHHLHPPESSAYDLHDSKGPHVEVHVLTPPAREEKDDADTDSLDKLEREAAVVANRVCELLGRRGSRPMQVIEKRPDETIVRRDLRQGDIAVLLRSMQGNAETFAEILRAAGLAVHADRRTGFFESLEVRDLLALLEVLDNQRQDIPLAALLRSPLLGIDRADDVLTQIRSAFENDPELPFHLAVTRYAHQRRDDIADVLRDRLSRLAGWRELVQRRPLPEALWQILEETGYLAFCEGLDNGAQRGANVLAVYGHARQFSTFRKQGLARFLNFMNSLRNQMDFGEPSVLSQADDVVRIMSIHGAKGLEFPVVFVPHAGKAHNLMDSAGSILIDRVTGVGMVAVDPQRETRYPTAAHYLAAQSIRRRSIAEELRVLYVATTRAREKLIVVGTGGKDGVSAWQDRAASDDGAFAASDIVKARSMLDWIGPAATVIARAGGHSVELIQHDVVAAPDPRGSVVETAARLKPYVELRPLAPPPPNNPAVDTLWKSVTQAYPHESFTVLPASIAVTALTHDRAMPTMNRARPGVETGPAASDIGIATHAVLE
ncbi:MAG: UvrD-helicase domain-containing protein, partial [Tepidisphaeraceae bacterium]